MITVYLVRHGQTEENLQRIFQGHMQGVLTKEGREQAAGLRVQLADLELDAVVSSDLQRVIDTVNLAFGNEKCELAGNDGRLSDSYNEKSMDESAVGLVNEDVNIHMLGKGDKSLVSCTSLSHHGRQIPWETTQLLREIDWGSWTGMFISSVDTSHLPADAETKEMLYARAGRFMKYLKMNYVGKSVLVVAHGLVNRSIQAQIEGVGVDHLYDVPHMKNAEMRMFRVQE